MSAFPVLLLLLLLLVLLISAHSYHVHHPKRSLSSYTRKVTITGLKEFEVLRGGASSDFETEDDDDDEEETEDEVSETEEEEEEEEQSESDSEEEEVLSKSVKKSLSKPKSKSPLLLFLSSLSPSTFLQMLSIYFKSLINPSYPSLSDTGEVSGSNLRSALERKANSNKGMGGRKGVRKMKRGQAKTINDLPKLNS